MQHSFEQYISQNNLAKPKDKILLAISGGIDSMFMLHLFAKNTFHFAVAHCNFCLRKNESDADEKFVKDFCKKNKIDFFSQQFDTKTFAKKNKLSTQMAARKLRYDWFDELMKKNKFKLLATAHHQNDVAETILINLTRGTGLAGLQGILPKQGKIIRPILFLNKNEIEEYVKKNKLKFREDSSNKKDDYMRNKIRHHVIPELKYFNPSLEKTFADFSKLMEFSYKIFELKIEELKHQIVSENKIQISIDLLKLKEKFEPKFHAFFLFETLKKYSFNFEQCQQIAEKNFKNTGAIFHSSTNQLLIDRNKLIVSLIDDEMLSFDISISNKIPKQFTENIFYLDADKLNFPLQFRGWKSGDKFMPLGMKNFKKVSDFFIDKKISRTDKNKAMVVLSGKEIIALLPYQIDERFKLTPQTKNVLKIT